MKMKAGMVIRKRKCTSSKIRRQEYVTIIANPTYIRRLVKTLPQLSATPSAATHKRPTDSEGNRMNQNGNE